MKYSKIFLSMLAVTLAVALAGCGTKVEVPPANVGKILTRDGFKPDTVPPSKFRLEACWGYCDKLVLLEASDTPLVEPLKVFMPKDQLNLSVDVRGTFTILPDDSLFDRIPAEPAEGSFGGTDDQLARISAARVYQTYGQQAVRGIVRSEITKYSIAEVMENRDAIAQNIHSAIAAKLKKTNTPVIISRFELADVQPPTVITQAKEKAAEREVAIKQAEADAQVAMVKLEKDLEQAKLTRLIRRENAEALAEENRIAKQELSPMLLEYRKVEAAERIYTALANSSNTIIVPADSSSFSNFSENTVLAKQLGKELKR